MAQVTEHQSQQSIKLFGALKDLLDADTITVDRAEGLTADELLRIITTSYPQLNELSSVQLTVNLEIATGTETIKADDELALVPPFSGG